jgi:hypothetical protein
LGTPFVVFSAETCECLGITNGEGFGDSCSNIEDSAGSNPYCYVSKVACANAGVAVEETTSTLIGTTAIGYSYEICLGIHYFSQEIKCF